MRQRSDWLKGCCSAQQVPLTVGESIQTMGTVHTNTTQEMTWVRTAANMVTWHGWPMKTHALTASLGCWKFFLSSQFHCICDFQVLSISCLAPVPVFHPSHPHIAIVSGVDLSWVNRTPTASQASSLTFSMPSWCAFNLWSLSFKKEILI